jgi:hypothetical protein
MRPRNSYKLKWQNNKSISNLPHHTCIVADPTGRFITPSSSGNNYLLIVYDYDSNYIHAEPRKNRSAQSSLQAYKTVLKVLQSRGQRPKLHRLDNEASQLLQTEMAEQQIDFQLTPAHMHRRIAAERDIRSFKNHFIAGLCSTDTDFRHTCGINQSRKHS